MQPATSPLNQCPKTSPPTPINSLLNTSQTAYPFPNSKLFCYLLGKLSNGSYLQESIKCTLSMYQNDISSGPHIGISLMHHQSYEPGALDIYSSNYGLVGARRKEETFRSVQWSSNLPFSTDLKIDRLWYTSYLVEPDHHIVGKLYNVRVLWIICGPRREMNVDQCTNLQIPTYCTNPRVDKSQNPSDSFSYFLSLLQLLTVDRPLTIAKLCRPSIVLLLLSCR